MWIEICNSRAYLKSQEKKLLAVSNLLFLEAILKTWLVDMLYLELQRPSYMAYLSLALPCCSLVGTRDTLDEVTIRVERHTLHPAIFCCPLYSCLNT